MDTVMATALRLPATETVQAISSEGFDEIIRQHQRRVYRVVFLLVRDADVADTLTQECFWRAYQKRADFRGECSLQTWLLRIALNLARDHSRNRRAAFWRKLVGLEEAKTSTSRAFSLSAPQPSPERALIAREQLQAVWDAVDSLSHQQRAIFLLRFAEEMSLEEVAKLLRIKVGTVKAHLFRATGKVREVLKEK